MIILIANEVTFDMFNDLTDDLLKELIPKIGPRIKFRKQVALLNADVVLAPSRDNEPLDLLNLLPSTSGKNKCVSKSCT